MKKNWLTASVLVVVVLAAVFHGGCREGVAHHERSYADKPIVVDLDKAVRQGGGWISMQSYGLNELSAEYALPLPAGKGWANFGVALGQLWRYWRLNPKGELIFSPDTLFHLSDHQAYSTISVRRPAVSAWREAWPSPPQ